MAQGKQVYIRFHQRIDEALTRASESTGLKRATLTAWIIEAFLRQVDEKCANGSLSLEQKNLSPELLGLSPLASLYAMKRGRSVGHAPRVIGKPILLTLPPTSERQLRLLAQLCDMSTNHFRSAIVATFLINQGILA